MPSWKCQASNGEVLVFLSDSLVVIVVMGVRLTLNSLLKTLKIQRRMKREAKLGTDEALYIPKSQTFYIVLSSQSKLLNRETWHDNSLLQLVP